MKKTVLIIGSIIFLGLMIIACQPQLFPSMPVQIVTKPDIYISTAIVPSAEINTSPSLIPTASDIATQINSVPEIFKPVSTPVNNGVDINITDKDLSNLKVINYSGENTDDLLNAPEINELFKTYREKAKMLQLVHGDQSTTLIPVLYFDEYEDHEQVEIAKKYIQACQKVGYTTIIEVGFGIDPFSTIDAAGNVKKQCVLGFDPNLNPDPNFRELTFPVNFPQFGSNSSAAIFNINVRKLLESSEAPFSKADLAYAIAPHNDTLVEKAILVAQLGKEGYVVKDPNSDPIEPQSFQQLVWSISPNTTIEIYSLDLGQIKDKIGTSYSLFLTPSENDTYQVFYSRSIN